MSLEWIDLGIHRLRSGLEDTVGDENQQPAFRAVQYERLADLYWTRYQVSYANEDYEAAKTYGIRSITYGHIAATTTPPGLSQQAQWWALQASRLEKQFIRFNDPQTLDGAVRGWDSALSVLERHGALRPVALINQANCLSRRYEAGGSEQDINRAIHNARAALRLAPESQCPAIQNDLSGMYLSRFEREDDLEDLNEALRHAEAAVERRTNEDPTMATRVLTLSNCRSALFETDGDIDHIRRAILDLRRAARYARRTGTDVLPRTLSRLAQCLWILHSETQHPTHLELAVNRAQEALQVSVDHGGAALHRAIVRDFANFLHVRDQRGRSIEEIEAAILQGEIPAEAG